jgi:hypothetical protein
MTQKFRGKSQFALLADSLPVRARIGLTLVAADLALDRLRSSRHHPIARAAFELARRWYDGQRFDPDLFEDAIAPESGRGVALCAVEAESEDEEAAWGTVDCAALYTAFHAFRALGKSPSPLVSEIDEDVLDELDKSLHLVSPDLIVRVLKAAEYLRHDPGASFSQLKSSISTAPLKRNIGDHSSPRKP